eukprot:1183054-Prorocentrum_minimum.AAC.2
MWAPTVRAWGKWETKKNSMCLSHDKSYIIQYLRVPATNLLVWFGNLIGLNDGLHAQQHEANGKADHGDDEADDGHTSNLGAQVGNLENLRGDHAHGSVGLHLAGRGHLAGRASHGSELLRGGGLHEQGGEALSGLHANHAGRGRRAGGLGRLGVGDASDGGRGSDGRHDES